MKKLALAVAALTMLGSSTAFAAEALLIRHEVLSVPVGKDLELKPGFFIGKAWNADLAVAKVAATDRRNLTLHARAPGRTIISAYSLREPHKRIEYEIVVVDEGMNAMLPALSTPAALTDAPEIPSEAALVVEEAAEQP